MDIKNKVLETHNLLEETAKLINEKNKKYYNDVLDFMNLLFEENVANLSKIKFKKITLNETIFKLYNEIIKEYKLNKPLFDIDNFNLEEIENADEMNKILFDIALKISNNILEKINYKLKTKYDKEHNKKRIILEYK